MSQPPLALGELLLWWLARRIQPYLPPRQPLPVLAYPLGESENMLVYGVVLPAPGAPDVVKRTLKITINGEAKDDVDAIGAEIKANDGDKVSLVLVDTDDAGNVSLPSAPFEFTAVDTIAPPAPGAVGVTLLREE